MRSIKLNAILLIVFSAVAAHAQQTAEPVTPNYERAVANEDGGQAFIIELGSGPLSALGRPRKGTIAAPEQCSIFLGSQWQTPELNALRAKLQNLLAEVSDENELKALQQLGVKNRFGPTVSAERADLNAPTFSDLEIQGLLSTMLDSGELPQPSPSTIYVFFLGPDSKSTLGPMAGGKHYLAYHNLLRSGGMIARYVVMPFQTDPANAYQTALKSFVAAAERPGHFAR